MSKNITHKDIADVLSFVTDGLQHTAASMTDKQLRLAIKTKFGIFWGFGGRDQLRFNVQGSGLKVWVSWGSFNHMKTRPVLEGVATVKAVRALCINSKIARGQMDLFDEVSL